MTTQREMVVALITEQLHLWQVDDAEPIPDPRRYRDPDDRNAIANAKTWLARRKTLDDLLTYAEGDDLVALLVHFAARVVDSSVKARQEHNVRLGLPPGEGDALSFMQTIAIGFLAEDEEDEDE
jgi:hypothetical protein